MKHKLKSEFLHNPVQVDVVGAGGNGSHLVNGLARLHLSLKALGHPHGFAVTLWDDDLVSEANVGRQLFSPADIGQPKAVVLINRLNAFLGLGWQAEPRRYNRQWHGSCGLLIGCVDTRQARCEMHQEFFSNRSHEYWLDLGNDAQTGQVILGERASQKGVMRLPTITELFPDLLDAKAQESTAPSCSLAVALERQGLFINQSLATFALNLLWRLFRFGEIDHHGYFINLESGIVTPLPIDAQSWARFGF